MILSYKQIFPFNGKPSNFKEKISEGIKIHSIREDLHNRWKPGIKIHHAYGMRTNKYECFAESVCTNVQEIEIREVTVDDIDASSYVKETIRNMSVVRILEIYIDNRRLTGAEFDILAKNDGFDSIKDFCSWFDKPFRGKIIHWTDFKYQEYEKE